MATRSPSILFLGLLLVLGSCEGSTDAKNDECWWHNAVIYQIYPKSFKSSTGNGMGDLKGIIEKFDYIKSLGVDAIWLNPIFPSESDADGGYDISDFMNIDPKFGTMDDFKNLMNISNINNIKVIMDFVPNHSSDKHDWFKRSQVRDGKYADYYVWRDPGSNTIPNKDNGPNPPNNWTSGMGGSAWKYDEGRKQFYLHQFLEQQPDLNYNNSLVQTEMEDVLKFWLNLGVIGFRMDAVFAIAEDLQFRDEPCKKGVKECKDYGDFDHIYTADMPETFNVLRKFRKVLDQFTANNISQERIMFTESYASDPEVLKKYYYIQNGNQPDFDQPIAHFPFNFIPLMTMKPEHTGKDWAELIQKWFKAAPMDRYWPNWVMGNHDQNRLSSRFTPEHADIITMTLMTLPGTYITYYGDELALQDSWVRPDEAQDTQGKRAPPDQFYQRTRDPERGPMPWNNTPFAGFSEKVAWLPIASQYWSVNVQTEEDSDRSHLKLFRALTKLRKINTMKIGDYAVSYNATSPEVLIVTRFYPDHPTVVTVVNFGKYRAEVYLSYHRKTLPSEMYVIAASTNFPADPKQQLSTEPITLEPVSGVVLSTEIFG